MGMASYMVLLLRESDMVLFLLSPMMMTSEKVVLLAGPQSSCCCLHVTITTVIVGSRSGRSWCCGVMVALGGKDVTVTKMLIEDVLSLLILIMDC